MTATPGEGTGREAIGNPSDEVSRKRGVGGIAESGNETDDLSCDGVVVEGGESVNERRDEEVRVEGEERSEERGVGDGLRELREGVGHVDGGRLGVGDEVGEAEQAD